MKINISLDDELVDRIDNYADKTYMSRSGLISLACTQYLNAQEMILAINGLSAAMRKIAAMGEIDEQSRKELEDFERVAKILTGQ